VPGHVCPQRRAVQDLLRSPHCVLIDEIVEADDLEPLGLDVGLEDLVGADHDRPAVIEGLQQGVAEPLDRGRIRDQVGGLVGVGQGIHLAAIRQGLPPVVDNFGTEDHVDLHQVGVVAQVALVSGPLVSGLVGDDQLAVAIQPPGQLHGELDALARHDAGRLQQEPLVGADSQIRPQPASILVRLRSRIGEVHHVGNQHRSAPGAQT